MEASMLINAREELRNKQRDQQLAHLLKSNQHNFIHLNDREFFDYAVNVKRTQGHSNERIAAWFESIMERANIVPELWRAHRDWVKNGSGLVPLGLDVAALTAIALEMQRSGSVFEKFKVKSYSGKNYIIFKGYSGLRRHLTGTRYLANNPKLVSFGIGKLGAQSSIKQGFVLTILISAGFHALEQLIDDSKTWHDFIGGLSVDVAIAAASSGIAWGAVTAVVGTAATVAVGPMIAVVVVGAALAGLAYTFIDTDAIAEKIAASLRAVENDLKQSFQQARREIDRAQRWYEQDPIGFMHRLFGLPYSGGYR
ncbi:hypothetical protein FIU82_03890 [Pseudoalteromonas sp. THAF3]|uniref:Uncharacterized protein n=2 Tax=Pseudoalteromonas TaxID=53246 RepID=A0A5S3Z6X9_9GAMM|nr:hypothetical protein FIU82_03890 [Pseudoalteromonas sp. THAF3]TLX49750.1 hypothetical protein CWC31_14875 [Pseudoalteromonas ruthenica]TMO45150.1 hypothetical protein CWC24_12720 [Pseudoalteromonas ruthenica]TMO48657.1 hypothetical protein CWC23_17085 [Pseudoalteromonas ruthenica]TMP87337.1 hypothetical protein CWC05_09630 [Pseudoalteromonas ruthenica]